MWYNGGMAIEFWLAISAGATFLLALAAFWTIWQNYQSQKRERKERLLKEINDWAIYGWSEVCPSGLGNWSKERLDIDKLTNLISRSSNVLYMASNISSDLEKQVREVLADLRRLTMDELKNDVEYKKLKGVEREKYIEHIKGLLNKISDKFSNIMIFSSNQ